MVAVFREVKRVLRDDGTLWLNLGDSYNAYNGNRGASTSFQSATEQACPDLPTGHGLTCKSLKPKDLVGIPWRVAFALQADGWYLRQDIIWAKGCSGNIRSGSAMPESVRDRFQKSHEYLFLFSKSARYFFDNVAVADLTKDAEQERQATRRSVWLINPQPTSIAHFATFPPALITPCILAGTSERGCCPKCGAPWERVVEKSGQTKRQAMNERGASAYIEANGNALNYKGGHDLPERETRTTGWRPGCECLGEVAVGEWQPPDPVPCTVLDPFGGSGTTGAVASGNGRRAVLVELNPEYAKLAQDRCGLFWKGSTP